MDPSEKFAPITTMEASTGDLAIWQVNMKKIKCFGYYFEEAIVEFDIWHEMLVVPNAVYKIMQKNMKSVKKLTPMPFLPSGEMPFFMMIDFKHIVAHNSDRWIFGRAAMRLHKYSFYKTKESHIKIDIGFPEEEESDSIDVGKRTEVDELKKLKDENPHWNGNQSKDEKRKKKEPHRSDDDQQSTLKMGWKNERVIIPDSRFSQASIFPYDRHATSRNPERVVIHRMKDQLAFKSGTEYAKPLYYRHNSLRGSSSTQISHLTNSNADHGSERNSQLYVGQLESGFNALSLSTTGSGYTGFSNDQQNQAGSNFSFPHTEPTYSYEDTKSWWNPTRKDATDTKKDYGQ